MDSTRLLRSLLLIFALTSCGGGGSSGDGTPDTTGSALNVIPAEPIAMASESIGSGGGTVTLDGAVLEIPPGALPRTVRVDLVAFPNQAQDLPAGDGALAGERPASARGYAISVSEDVTLSSPLQLTIPLSLDAGSFDSANLRAATDRAGYLVSQDYAVEYDATNNALRVTVPAQQLQAEAKSFLTPMPPHGVGIALLAIVTAFGGTVSFNPIVAALRDTGYETLQTGAGHFNIRYHPPATTREDAIALEVPLERAYALFVTDMGFNLPNFFNLDGRYNVVLDDLATHSGIRRDGNGQLPDGFTLPGSSLFEGASFINSAGRDETKRQTTAVHEYFHALQAGALTGITPLLADAKVFSESSWWFEGSATALSGRVIAQNGQQPARDPTLDQHLRAGTSLFNPDAQDPAADVAQDFCYFLEKGFGGTDFYLPVFEDLGINLLADDERAVRALDAYLRDTSNGSDNISIAWEQFITDWVIDNTAEYGGGPNAGVLLNHRRGNDLSDDTLVDPLGYQLVQISVPPLETDSQGIPLPGQRVDLEVELTLSSSSAPSGALDITVVDALSPQATIREPFDAFTNAPRIRRFSGFRTTSPRNLYLVVANSNSDRSFAFQLGIRSKLVALPNYEVVYWRNFDGTQGNGSFDGSDFSLSGSTERPLISWTGPAAIAIEVADSRDVDESGNTTFDYGIISQDDPDTGEAIPFGSPVQYGDYSIAGTEPFEVADVPSPPLEAGDHIYFFTIAGQNQTAGQFAIRLNPE